MRLAVNPVPDGRMMRLDGTPLRIVVTPLMQNEGEETTPSGSYLLSKEEAAQLALDLYSGLMQVDAWDEQEPPEYQLTEHDLSHGETELNPYEEFFRMEEQS